MVIAPARIAGDPGSNPGPGENFSLKLLIYIYRIVKGVSLGSGEGSTMRNFIVHIVHLI